MLRERSFIIWTTDTICVFTSALVIFLLTLHSLALIPVILTDYFYYKLVSKVCLLTCNTRGDMANGQLLSCVQC